MQWSVNNKNRLTVIQKVAAEKNYNMISRTSKRQGTTAWFERRVTNTQGLRIHRKQLPSHLAASWALSHFQSVPDLAIPRELLENVCLFLRLTLFFCFFFFWDLLCIHVCFVFMRVCLHVYVCCACLVTEWVLDYLELDLDGCKLTSRYWKLNEHPLQEEQVPLTTEASLPLQ